MNYEVRLRRSAQKELDAFYGSGCEMLARAISSLGQNPRPPRVKKLADSSLRRVRTGHYGIVYAIDNQNKLVTIVRVATRKEDTYKNL
ncbi:MAG: type II toxin-antitoxin system RelE/ParE family toxin [Chloroflexota bacterium]|nr:type II toxin-antitoxin system RelE/ParE family toxin [Chloroflexota bacterium]